MARLNVNPTRMELRRLKSRLKTAVRGHKLLKDKSDEMIRQFMNYVRRNKELREGLEGKVSDSLRAFMIARSFMTSQAIEEAIAMPSKPAVLYPSTVNVMGLNVPKIKIEQQSGTAAYPYSFISTSCELDHSINNIQDLLGELISLSEVEKTCNMLASEIEKNRRRVNALEYVLIPQLKETIKYITMKLEENERGNLTRLMKVKSMLAERENTD